MSHIAVLGGTFDPPHFGHLVLAEQAREQTDADRVLWVPAGDPPLKEGQLISPIEDRLAMVRLTVHGNDTFQVSLDDIERPGPHFTVDLIERLQTHNPGSDLLFVMGADSLQDLPRWRQPDRLIALTRLVVMRRPGTHYDLDRLEAQMPGIRDRLIFVDAPLMDLAGRDIRRYVSEGRSIRYLVPEAVREYIRSAALYQNPSSE